jgi:hypothetical protein
MIQSCHNNHFLKYHTKYDKGVPSALPLSNPAKMTSQKITEGSSKEMPGQVQ